MQKRFYILAAAFSLALLLCGCNEKQLQDNSFAGLPDIPEPPSSVIEKSEPDSAIEASAPANPESGDNEDTEAKQYIAPQAPEIPRFEPERYTLTDTKHLQSDEDMFFVISPQLWHEVETEKFMLRKQGTLYYVKGEQAGILLEEIFEISGINADGLYLIQRSGEGKFRLIRFNPVTKEIKEIKDRVCSAVLADENTMFLAIYSMGYETIDEAPPQIERLDLTTGEITPVMTADLTLGPYDGFCVDIGFSVKDNTLSATFMYFEVEWTRYFRRVEIDLKDNHIIADSEQKAIRASDKYDLYQGNFEPVNNPENEVFWIAANSERISKDTPGFLPEDANTCSNLNYMNGLYYYLCYEEEVDFYKKACVFDGKKSEQLQLYDLESVKIIDDQPRISYGSIFEYQGELYLIGQLFAAVPEYQADLSNLALYRLAGIKENPTAAQPVLMIRDNDAIAGGPGPFTYSHAGAYVIIETTRPYHMVIKNLKSGDMVTLFDDGLHLLEP